MSDSIDVNRLCVDNQHIIRGQLYDNLNKDGCQGNKSLTTYICTAVKDKTVVNFCLGDICPAMGVVQTVPE